MPKGKTNNKQKSTALARIDQVHRDLAKAGFDCTIELQKQIKGMNIEPPRVKIEHLTSGRHRMFIDLGESYVHTAGQFEELDGNKLEAIVALAQPVRAWFVEGEKFPKCAGIEDMPTAIEPVCDTCIRCKESIPKEGKCKPKIRLFLLQRKNGSYRPLVFPLSPTSIKRWKAHIKALNRDKLPYVAVVTTFELEDASKGSFQWAEVKLGANGMATAEELQTIMQFRKNYEGLFGQIDKRDFEDPGDDTPPNEKGSPPEEEEDLLS